MKVFLATFTLFLQISWLFHRKAVPLPAKPLNDAQMCGSFSFYTMNNRIPFQKPYTNAHDLLPITT